MTRGGEWVRAGRWDSRQQADQHQEDLPDRSLVPAGPSELGVVSQSITARQLWFGTTAPRLGQMGWYRCDSPAAPPTAPVLLVGEVLVPDGWEDSVGIEL